MIFNIVILGLVLGLAYAWMVRGFFNAFIHLLCVLVAGALAFAVWEPASLFLIGASPDRGLLSFVGSAAWGIGLLVPFAAFLLLFRVITDKVVKANIKNATAADYAGGAVCGLAVGVLTAGVFIIGIQGLRLPTNMGYRPVWYTEDRAAGAGSLVYSDTLWLPADRITAAVYKGLSRGSMSTSQPLAKWYPDLAVMGFAARLSPGDGAGRNTIEPDDFRVIKTYTVGAPDRALPANELLAIQGQTVPQRYLEISGEAPSSGRLMGFVIEFQPGAKERGAGRSGGQVIVSNGQVQLIVRDTQTGQTQTLFPVAAISENTEADGRIGRWRFDANDVFIASVGAASQPVFAFEFLLPEGHEPLGLSVRQTRKLIANVPEPVVLQTVAERDQRIASGAILRTEEAAAQRDASNAVTIDPTNRDNGVLVGATLGEILASQTARSRVTLDDENRIAEGQARFSPEEVGRSNAPTGRAMRVDSFAVGPNQTMVQIDVSPGMPASFVSQAARLAPTDRPIVLVDANGNEYQAIGFIYSDRELFEVRYTQGNTLAGIDATPPLSTARDDQKLVILFLVTTGSQIEQLAVGDIVLAQFEPDLTARTSGRP